MLVSILNHVNTVLFIFGIVCHFPLLLQGVMTKREKRRKRQKEMEKRKRVGGRGREGKKTIIICVV